MRDRLDQYQKECRDLAEVHPAYALGAARSAAEAICRELFETHVGTAGTARLEDLLRKLTERSILPVRIQVPLRTLQAYGNLGVHDSDDRSKIDSGFIKPALQALDVVIAWYYSTLDSQAPTVAASATSAAADTNGSTTKTDSATECDVEATSDLEPPQSVVDSQPICGRERECAQISSILSAVLSSRTGGRVVVIGGESGSGKTTVSEVSLRTAADLGFHVARTSCEPFHEGMSFFPIRELVRLLADPGGSDHIAQTFGETSTQVAMAKLANSLDADPSARRDATVATFANTVFARVAFDQKPLLLFVDDLERIDAASVDALMCLVARLREGPVVLMGAYRSDVVTGGGSSAHPLRPLLQAARRSEGHVALGPLTPDEVSELVEMTLGAPCDLPTSFRRRLLDETQGNPLHVREVINNLRADTGLDDPPIRLVNGRWKVLRIADRWEIPSSIEDAIASRLNILDDSDRSIIEVAAVVGGRFPYSVIVELSRVTEDELFNVLERLLSLEILREVSGSGEVFEFRHAKIRDVLYNGMTGLRRQRLHGQVADALATARETLPHDEWEVLVGSHLFAARRYDAAAPYLMSAGERSLKLQAGVEAIRHYLRAREALEKTVGTTQEQLDSIGLQLGVSYKLASELDAADQQFLLLLRSGSDGSPTRWALNHLGDTALMRGRIAEAIERYSECEVRARERGDTALLAETAADLAELHMRQMERLAGIDPAASAEHGDLYNHYLEIEQSLAPQLDEPAAQARSYRNSAKRARSRGMTGVAIALYEQSLQYVDEGVNSHQFLIPYAKALRLVNRYDDALSVVRKVLDWSQQLGAQRSEAIALQYLGLITMELELQSGSRDLAGAIALMQKALATHAEVGFEQGRRETEIDLGEVAAHLGNAREAIAHFREATDTGGSASEHDVIVSVLAQLAANGEHARVERIRSALTTN